MGLEQALRIANRAGREAAKAVGDNREAIEKEINRRATSDAELFKALQVVGLSVIEGQQSPQH